jgi:hypothetical protein
MTSMTSLPKPRRGAKTAEQRARARLAQTRERAAKDAAKLRDHYTCRRCHGAMLQGPLLRHVEAAHIDDKGMGGDPTGLRSWQASDYVTLCLSCHQGPRGVHSGHVVIQAGPKGGDGPVRFVNQKAGAA